MDSEEPPQSLVFSSEGGVFGLLSRAVHPRGGLRPAGGRQQAAEIPPGPTQKLWEIKSGLEVTSTRVIVTITNYQEHEHGQDDDFYHVNVHWCAKSRQCNVMCFLLINIFS